MTAFYIGLWISTGFYLQFEFILLKMRETSELVYFFAKAFNILDIILAVIFFPIYIYMDYLFSIGEDEKSQTMFDIWMDIVFIFLYIPVYFPLKVFLKIEVYIRNRI